MNKQVLSCFSEQDIGFYLIISERDKWIDYILGVYVYEHFCSV